jgi:hypothetical protein
MDVKRKIARIEREIAALRAQLAGAGEPTTPVARTVAGRRRNAMRRRQRMVAALQAGRPLSAWPEYAPCGAAQE